LIFYEIFNRFTHITYPNSCYRDIITIIPFTNKNKMTQYNETFFNPVPGLIPQLILACTAQEVCNRKYQPSSISVDYATGSITTTISVSDDDKSQGRLQIDINFPVSQQSGLKRRSELAERITSVTDLSLDSVPVGREFIYPRLNDFPVPLKPDYLSGTEDTLERRIAWLCQVLVNVKSWLKEWNQFALICEKIPGTIITLEYLPNDPVPLITETTRAKAIRETLKKLKVLYILSPASVAIGNDEDAITDYTDYLLNQLNTQLKYRKVPYYDSIDDYIPVSSKTLIEGMINSTSSELEYVDQLGESVGSSVGGNDYSDFVSTPDGDRSPSVAPDYSPIQTLSDC
jgi:hypothetical protein